jgi:hypothetical protein
MGAGRRLTSTARTLAGSIIRPRQLSLRLSEDQRATVNLARRDRRGARRGQYQIRQEPCHRFRRAAQ